VANASFDVHHMKRGPTTVRSLPQWNVRVTGATAASGWLLVYPRWRTLRWSMANQCLNTSTSAAAGGKRTRRNSAT
jgi:hypothetical protein